MSTPVIDTITNRTSTRLTAFLSRVEQVEPADNISVDYPTYNLLYSKKKVVDGGRQHLFTLDTALNTTIQPFGGYDVFDVTAQDNVRPAVYSYVNYGGTVVISWEEMRETANSDVRTFDLLKNKRSNAIKAMKDRLNAQFLATSVEAQGINTLPVMITTTGSPGEISASANTWWQAQENASVGAFAANGLASMRDLYNDIVRQGQGSPTNILTTQAVHQNYEAELDPDVRYSDPNELARGAKKLTFKGGVPVEFDNDMPTGHLYMLNFDHIYLECDSAGQMQMGEMIEAYNGMNYAAKFAFRGQLVMTNRRALGRMTGLT